MAAISSCIVRIEDLKTGDGLTEGGLVCGTFLGGVGCMVGRAGGTGGAGGVGFAEGPEPFDPEGLTTEGLVEGVSGVGTGGGIGLDKGAGVGSLTGVAESICADFIISSSGLGVGTCPAPVEEGDDGGRVGLISLIGKFGGKPPPGIG
jgi:hypothetical protein